MHETLTPAEFHVMQHALGLDRGRKAYRNHWAETLIDGKAGRPVLDELVTKGLMTRNVGDAKGPFGGQGFYHVTPQGLKAVAGYFGSFVYAGDDGGPKAVKNRTIHQESLGL